MGAYGLKVSGLNEEKKNQSDDYIDQRTSNCDEKLSFRFRLGCNGGDSAKRI